MTLNPQQQAFYDTVKSLDFGKLLLLGEGGTGKTYVLSQVLTNLAQDGKRICVAAPTHSALSTIKSKFDPEMSANITFVTVASLLQRYGFRTPDGENRFRRPKSGALTSFDLIAVDEISMVSILEQAALMAKESVPVVFTGDLSQLPVVMQKSADWSEVPTFNLTEQVRQSGIIHEIAGKCRDAIYVPTAEDADGKTTFLVEDLKEKMLSDMKAYDVPLYHFRYLAWRNSDVDSANDYFHQNLFGKDPFYAGEHLILRSTGSFGHNGQVVTVKSVLETQEDEQFGVTTNSVELMTGDIIQVLSPEDQKKVAKLIDSTKSLLKQSLEAKNWDAAESYGRDLENLESSWVGWSYAYASTVHRSQGMTIPHVYVDIAGFHKSPQKKSLIYVGVSRASETLSFNQGTPKVRYQDKYSSMWVRCDLTGKKKKVSKADGCPEGFTPVSRANR